MQKIFLNYCPDLLLAQKMHKSKIKMGIKYFCFYLLLWFIDMPIKIL